MAMIRVTELDKIITDGLNNHLKKGSWGKDRVGRTKRAAAERYVFTCKLDSLENLLSDQGAQPGALWQPRGVREDSVYLADSY